MMIRSRSLGAAIAASVLACAASASAQVTWGTYEQPLEGRRYETLRALANYLDEAAQNALADAIDDARYGTAAERAAERRLLTQIRRFARQAENFHERIDNYESREPADIVDDVELLAIRARRTGNRIQQARGLQTVRDDWQNITDALDRMRRLLAGEEVQVPSAYGALEDYERDYGPFEDPSRRPRGFTDAEVQQFRQLARDLDTSANRAWQLGQRSSSVAGVSRYISDLQHFASQASALHRRVNENLDINEVTPTVNHLLEDARAADRNMRQGSVLRDVWYEWTRTISLLTRMNDMVTRR